MGNSLPLSTESIIRGGVAPAITTSFHYTIMEVVYEGIQDVSIPERGK